MPSLHCLREINQSRMFILKYIKGDKVIWAVVVLLSLLSILVVYSSVVALAYRYKNGDTASYLIKHVFIVASGIFLMYLVHKVKYSYFSRIVKTYSSQSSYF